MRQARPVMIAFRPQEHLRLMHKAAKRFAMRDPVDIALVACPDFAFRLGPFAAF